MEPRTVNIVLIGPSGVGKTFFINGLANHMRFDCLDDALNGSLESPAPACFSLENEDGKNEMIRFGPHKDGKLVFGYHNTSRCISYEVEVRPLLKFRIVDTPPFQNKSEQTTKNVDNIIESMCQIDMLHAICIFFHANETEEGMALGGLEEFLARLPKGVTRNVCFIMTFASSSMYNTGQVKGIMIDFIKNLKTMNENLIFSEKPRLFYLDNEGLKYVMAVKSNVKPKEISRSICTESWVKSRNNYKSIVDYIISLVPFPRSELCTFVRLEKVEAALRKGGANIFCKLVRLKEHMLERKKTIEYAKTHLIHLEKTKYREIMVQKCREMERPQVVCTNENCSKLRGNASDSLLTRRSCHLNCFCQPYNCMYFVQGNCDVCGCGEEYHFYTKMKLVNETEKVEDKSAIKEISTTSAMLTLYEDGLNEILIEERGLKKMLEVLKSTVGTCQGFYQQHAIKVQMESKTNENFKESREDFTYERLWAKIKQLKTFIEISEVYEAIEYVLRRSDTSTTGSPKPWFAPNHADD